MAPLIPRIESAEVGSKPLAYLIRPGSDFRGDRIRCDTGVQLGRAQRSFYIGFNVDFAAFYINRFRDIVVEHIVVLIPVSW